MQGPIPVSFTESMNPILGSRMRNMIRWRKQVLFEHVNFEPQPVLLRSINQEIITLIDHCLDLLEVPRSARRPKAYRKKELFRPGSAGSARPLAMEHLAREHPAMEQLLRRRQPHA